jgi:excisionase family DNA binding protein
VAIQDLASHPAAYVSVDELARYWGVSRARLRKYIEDGELEAMALGPRLVRISTRAALKLEERLSTSTLAALLRHRIDTENRRRT